MIKHYIAIKNDNLEQLFMTCKIAYAITVQEKRNIKQHISALFNRNIMRHRLESHKSF